MSVKDSVKHAFFVSSFSTSDSGHFNDSRSHERVFLHAVDV